MKNDNKPIAIIPLRSGSKRIPNKNIKLLNGKPLGSYVLESALKSNIFKEIIVSTDKKEIYDTVYNGLSEYVENDCKKHISLHLRSEELSGDKIQQEDVMLNVIEEYEKNIEFNNVYLIQATTPFTTPEDFINSYKLFLKNGCISMLSATKLKRFIWQYNNIIHNSGYFPINYSPLDRPPMKDFGGSYIENGAFYITKVSALKLFKCRLVNKVGIYEMQGKGADIDIDDMEDWEKAIKILKNEI